MAEFVRLPLHVATEPFLEFLSRQHGAQYCWALFAVLMQICRQPDPRESERRTISLRDLKLICHQHGCNPDTLVSLACEYEYLELADSDVTSPVADQWMLAMDEARTYRREQKRRQRSMSRRQTETDGDSKDSLGESPTEKKRKEEKRKEEKEKKGGDARDPAREAPPPPEVDFSLEISKSHGVPEPFARPRIAEYSARGWRKSSGTALRTSHEVAAAIATRWHESEGDRYRTQTQSVTSTTGVSNGTEQAIALMERRAAEARARSAAQPAR